MGRVREVDRPGNNEADAAAALGWRRVHHSVTYARRVVTRSCARWYPVVRELHRFFIAIAWSVLNNDGTSGTTLHRLSGRMLQTRRGEGLSQVVVTLLGCF